MAQSSTSSADDDFSKIVENLIEAAKGDYASGHRTSARSSLNKVFDFLEAGVVSIPSPENHAKLLAAERNLGHFCEDQEDREGALYLFKRSLAFAETRFYPGGHLEVATSLAELGVAYGKSGDQATAQPLLKRCLQIREASLPDDHEHVLVAVENLAYSEAELGHVTEAVNLRERSLALLERNLGRDNPKTLRTLESLANLHHTTGDFAKALPLYRSCLSIAEKQAGIDLSETGWLTKFISETNAEIRESIVDLVLSMNNMATICKDMGNFSEAVLRVGQSRRLSAQVFGDGHAGTLFAMNLEGMILFEQGKIDEAEHLFRLALDGNEKIFGKGRIQTSGPLNNLALALKSLGQDAEALECSSRSLAILEKALGPDDPRLIVQVMNLACAYRDHGDFDTALPLHERSVAMSQKALGVGHPLTVLASANLVIWSIRQGVFPDSMFSPDSPLATWSNFVPSQLPMLSDSQSFQLVEKFHFMTEGLHSMCAMPLRSQTGSISWLGAQGLAMSKALIEESSSVNAMLEADPHQATKPIRQRLQELQQQLEQLPTLKLEAPAREERRRMVQTELSQLETSLEERGGFAGQVIRERSFKLQTIASHLPSNAVLLDLIQYRPVNFMGQIDKRGEARYAAYVTFPSAKHATNLVVERVDLGEAAPIDAAVETIARRMSAGEFRAKDLAAALQRVSELVYAPLARHLTNVSHLIVCPDGQLSRLPFEMLYAAPGGKYLIEEKTISYVGSGREVARLGEGPANEKSKRPNEKSLVMGNPDFDLELNVVGNSRGQETPSGKTGGGRQNAEMDQSLVTSTATKTLSRSYRGQQFAPLPGAGDEARAVAKMLGDDCVLRLGAEAREAELKAVQSPRVLHLATHGFFLSDQEFKSTNAFSDLLASTGGFPPRRTKDDWENPLVRCGIALAGANHARRITNAVAEDGLLTGLEASLLNLQGTELVILSACDSGTGEVKTGEGVMSLRRAFRIAGAESVLASHWKVSDQATGRLMTEFMRRWRGGAPRAQAWREAQLSLLRSKDFANPYYWAAFTLTGQWR